MATKKLTHAELAAAQERKDWALLWQHAMPLVKLVIGRLGKSGAAHSPDRPGTRDKDLLQQGMLTAGEAMREWKPLECAFSTHICNAVRWKTHEFQALRRNGGIGSHVQRPAVFNTSDSRDGLYGFSSVDYDNGDEDEGGTFDDALTYEGVRRDVSGQYDGIGVVPEGFDNPEKEATRIEEWVRVRLAATALRDKDEREVVLAVLTGEAVESYATRISKPERTVRNWYRSAKEKMAVRLR